MSKKILSILAASGAIIAQSQAQITQATSPAALPTTDSFGWGQLGANGTSVSSPQTVTSVGGMTATVSDAGGSFDRIDQGFGWSGNFSSGDKLLWTTTSDNGPITVDFATAVSGAGAQIQADYFGGFTAVITAYGPGNVLLGSESINGNSDNSNNGSAVFIGLSSTSADITSVVFSLSSAANNPNDFAIDTLDISTPSAVPDAGSTSCLLAMSCAGLGFLRRKLAKA